MFDTDDVSIIFGINVTHDRGKGVITINQNDYTEHVAQRYGMEGCNPMYTPRVEPELSLNRPEETRLKSRSGATRRSLEP